MYIRTKDGVYEVKVNKYHELVYCKNNQLVLSCNIINQSDTIEELCDLFIDEKTKTIFHKHNGYLINWKTNMVYSLKELVKSFHSVKGTIYTSEGLIYVAKMNDKGVLELI